MNWRVDLSRDAEKFLRASRLAIEDIRELIARAIRHFRGEDVNINVRKLKGEWTGFYRIRSGRIRIIAEFDFDRSAVFVERIDWRGNVY